MLKNKDLTIGDVLEKFYIAEVAEFKQWWDVPYAGTGTWYWDGGNASYFHKSVAQKMAPTMVPEELIRRRGQAVVQASAGIEIKNTMAKLNLGAISLAEFQEDVYRELKDASVVMLQLGRGGQASTTFSDYGRVGAHLKGEKQALENFAQQIANEQLTWPQINARLDLYVEATMVPYNMGRTAAMTEAGFKWERRYLTPAEHCDDCINYAELGWQAINTLPEPGQASRCMRNCKCVKEFSKDDDPNAESLRPVTPRSGQAMVPAENTFQSYNARGREFLTKGENTKHWDVRSNAKDAIAQELQKRVGCTYDEANDFIQQWAKSSNDNHMASMKIQEAASRKWKIPMSEWQELRYNELLTAGREDLRTSGMIEQANRPLFSNQYGDFTGSVGSSVDDIHDKLLQAMYDYTQDELKEAGIDRLVLTRGFDPSTPETKAVLDNLLGEKVAYEGNVLESWSVSQAESANFGTTEFFIEIPRERILGSARTGFGCLDEMEYVVMGSSGGDEAYVLKSGGERARDRFREIFWT